MADEQFLDHYQLLERIGHGGMAEVYHARDLAACGREVAIKVIRSDLTEDPALSRRFLREVRALSRLAHPHILSPLACGEENGRPYLVMPWVRDGTLSQLLKERQGLLPLEEALPLFAQLCQAVQYIHEEGIIHRDLKPQNILVQQGSHLFLADFGIALDRTEAQQTPTEGGLGSMHYMAPEQAVGQATARSDLYSLGIILYQLLTGVVPFSGDTPLQVLLQHAYAPLPDPRQFQPNLPVALVQVLQKALAKDPRARFQSAQALEQAARQAGSISAPPGLVVDAPVPASTGLLPLSADLQGWSAWPGEASYQDARHQAARPRLPARPLMWRNGSWRGIAAAVLLLLVGMAALEASYLIPGPQQTGPAAHAAQPAAAVKGAARAIGHSAPSQGPDNRSGGDQDHDGGHGHRHGHDGDDGGTDGDH